MLDGSFDVVTAIRDLAVELDVLRRRVRLLEDAVAALGAPVATSASGSTELAEVSVEPVVEGDRRGGKREKAAAVPAAGPSVVTDGAADAG